jgi:hypothetical protein
VNDVSRPPSAASAECGELQTSAIAAAAFDNGGSGSEVSPDSMADGADGNGGSILKQLIAGQYYRWSGREGRKYFKTVDRRTVLPMERTGREEVF